MGNPYVSVVILTTKVPIKVLECLEKQTFKDFEVIVASEKGIVNAMNNALENARGNIFVRIDDDVELPERWLEQLVKPFFHDYVAGVTGPTFVPKDRREYRDSIRYAENPGKFLKWLYDNGEFRPGGIRKCGCVSYDSNYQERFKKDYMDAEFYTPAHLEGTNWAMRTELIRKVGGFDPKFDGVAEWFDTDVEAKIKKLGYCLVYNPKAYLYHLLEKGEHYNERFDGFGRIKNWLRYHWRHSKFHPKMVVFLLVWTGYFLRNTNSEGKVSGGEGVSSRGVQKESPRSTKVASKGVCTSQDFAQLMSALMSDLIEGRVTPNVANATCNAGGKLLKVVEMTYKYGTEGGAGKKSLSLTFEDK